MVPCHWRKGGPFSLAGDTKTFASEEPGTYRTKTFSGPVHFRDSAGRWVDIDTTLGRAPDGRFGPKATANPVSVAASSSAAEVASLRIDATHSVGFAIDAARPVTGMNEGNRMRFPSVWEGIDIELAVQPAGVKEDIVVQSKQAARDFRFPLRLQGLTAAIEEDGGIAYRDEAGVVRARTPAGHMEDAASARSDAVTYRLVPNGGVGIALEVVPDRGWLEDPARQYPVRVDPSLFVSTDGEDDTYIWFGGGYGAADRAYEGNLNVGSNDGWNYARAYMNFDMFPMYGKVIESARFSIYQYSANSCAGNTFSLHRVDQAWGGHSMTGPPGAALGAWLGNMAMGCDANWRAWDVADVVRGWASNPWGAFGLALRADSEPNGTTLRQFYSWNSCGCAGSIPHIDITWRETYDPYGSVDAVEAGVGGVRVAGWAIDPDTTASIPVHVYVGSVGTAITADTYRPDVGAAFGYGDYHGYDQFIPAASGTHEVCLYAINIAGAGSNQQLGCRTVVISGEPFGDINEVTGVLNGVKVRGWAIDPDTTSSIPVHVYVGSAGTAITADTSRPDVAAVYPRYGDRHGFDAVIPVAGVGSRNVCIYAINAAGLGGNTLLGCRTVTVAMQPTAPQNVVVEPSNELVSVEWTAPEFDGGSPITGYTVIVHHAGSGAEVARTSVSGMARFTLVQGLTNGQSYYARIYASNGVGDGASTSSGAVTPFASPLNASELYGDDNPATLSVTCRTSWGVNCATGNFSRTFEDLVVPGRGRPLHFTRTYNAQANLVPGPLGNGWTHSYNMSLQVFESGTAVVSQENGSTASFRPDGQGGYRARSQVLATLARNADGSWTFARKRDLTSFVFDDAGRLVRQVDPNGYATNLAYVAGRLDKVTDPAGRSLVFTHRPDGLLERVADSAGRSVTFGYDAAGHNTRVTDVNNKATTFAYDPETHHLESTTDPRNQVITNDYDCATICQSGPGRSFSYTFEAGTTTIVDPKGHKVIARHQGWRLVSLTRGVGTPQEATTTFAYDPVTMGVTSRTDANQHTWTSTFDANGNQTSEKDPLNREWTATYTASNRVETLKDASGVTTSYTYDVGSNLKSMSRPLVGTSQTATTTFAYDPGRPGDLVSVTDPTNRTWRNAYDAAGNRTRAEDPLGNATTFGYDAGGRMTSSVAPKGNVAGANPAAYTTTYVPNAYGDLLSVRDPLGHPRSWEYDANRNLKVFTDANLRRTTYDYNTYDELITVTRPDTTTERTDYDANGNVASQTDPLNRTTTYGYDALNRPTSVTDPLNRTTTATYDGVGNRKTLRDPAGRTTTFDYDVADQLKTVDYSDPGTADVSFTYDVLGRRKTMADGTGTSSYDWDSLDRLTSHTNGANRTVGYGYDLASRLTSIAYPALGTVAAGTVTRAYDGAGRLQSVTDWAARRHVFGYDANDNLATQTYPSAATATFTYDAADRLANVAHAKGNKSIASFGYTRDAADLLTAENSQTYGYDVNDRLKSSSPSPSTSFDYDAADNPIKLVSGTLTSNLTYDAAHQLATLARSDAQSFSFAYDTQGNRTAKKNAAGAAVVTYAYDQANRLTSTGSTTYTYDGDGLRTAKTGTGATSFVWEVAEGLPLVLAEGTTRYVTGPGGLPLHQVTAAGTASFYHADQLGSTRALTDSTGKVVVTYAYDPYGNLATSTGTIANPFRYAGQYTDAESGLQQLRARYYDPATAQFLSRDPLVALTRQTYTYGDASPLNAIDPTGLHSCTVGAQTGGVGGARVEVLSASGSGAAAHSASAASPVTSATSPCKGGHHMHHTVPRQILNKLPPDVAKHPAVRGSAGKPNKWPLPAELHRRVHGKGGGPKYNVAWMVELTNLGGPPTVADVLQIRDMLAKRFGFWHCKP